LKIVFICSSLEPGRDGVGDYIRRIACELIKQGNEVAVLSINDKYVIDPYITSQQMEGVKLPVFRLPASQLLKERIFQARKYIEEFNPDWLSLQFVIFGYHPKGLPLWLNKLSLLGKGRKWHIMFHELWLGMELNTSRKHLLWGKIQQYLINRLIIKLKPVVIHTHTQLYIQQLSNIAVQSRHLPLFGNIPVISSTKASKSFKENRSINMVLFGHIHPNAPVVQFAPEIAEYAKIHQLKISLTLIGNNGAETEHWIKQFENSGIKVNVLGEQPANYVSEIMSNTNIGISTTPAALLEKSGSVAAMREHGLAVICVPCAWEPAKFVNLELPGDIMIYKQGNLNEMLNGDINFTGLISVTDIGNQFIKSLSNV
jgi:hypothetical protein